MAGVACVGSGTTEAYQAEDTVPTSAVVADSSPTTTLVTPDTTTTNDNAQMSYDAPPDLIIDPDATYTATISTNLGDIVIEFFADTAPNTVNNFVFLAGAGYYDGVIFHRVIPGFVAQAGDPTGTGRGGPGYTFADELTDPRPYTRGIVAMANAGPDTNGSQFFVVHQDVSLPYAYTIFGEVTSGMEVVDAMTEVPTGPGDKPTSDIVIESITVTGP